MFDQFVSSPTGVPAVTFGGLSGSGGTIALQNNAAAPLAVNLTVGGNNQSTTYGGLLSGLGAITKTGTGTLTLTGSNNYAGQTVLNGGVLEMGLAAQSPILTGGGINIQSGHIVFDYTSSGNDPANTIYSELQSSYDNGAWDQGQFQSSTATSLIGLGWIDNTIAQKVTVQTALNGNVNLDGSVNATDLSIILSNYGIWYPNPPPGPIMPGWANGDFNYDGQVNAADLAKVLANYGMTGGPALMVARAAGVSPVPEPSTIAMLASLSALAGLWAAQRRRRAAAFSGSRHAMYLPRGV